MKNRTFYIYTAIVISILILSAVIGHTIYSHWKSNGIDDENGYNSINAVIALISLAFHIITVMFIYATYQSSLRQNHDSSKNIEYDRALDNIYRQLAYTKQSHLPLLEQYTRLNDGMHNTENLYRNLFRIRRFLDDFSDDIELYIMIIEKESFTVLEKSFLLNIVFKNYNRAIKELYHKIYSIKVSHHDDNLYESMGSFFMEYYKAEESEANPNFSDLSQSEQEQIIKGKNSGTMADRIFTLQIILEKLDWIKSIENQYVIKRKNVFG